MITFIITISNLLRKIDVFDVDADIDVDESETVYDCETQTI